tara:strand:- start:1564 stop:1743 length:180 start_codon:yes stop_codon:yes gene_type:complete
MVNIKDTIAHKDFFMSLCKRHCDFKIQNSPPPKMGKIEGNVKLKKCENVLNLNSFSWAL